MSVQNPGGPEESTTLDSGLFNLVNEGERQWAEKRPMLLCLKNEKDKKETDAMPRLRTTHGIPKPYCNSLVILAVR